MESMTTSFSQSSIASGVTGLLLPVGSDKSQSVSTPQAPLIDFEDIKRLLFMMAGAPIGGSEKGMLAGKINTLV